MIAHTPLSVKAALLLATLTVNCLPTQAAFVPNDPFYLPIAPHLPGQWHLYNQAPAGLTDYFSGNVFVNAGLDSNVLPAWNNNWTGQGVVIGILDNGVQGDHPDLAENYRADLSYDFVLNTASQGPVAGTDNHGTPVAGVAAARGGNGIGVTGVAPFAQIAGLRIFTGTTIADSGVASALRWKSGFDGTNYIGDPEIHIKNHSYSYGFFGVYAPSPLQFQAIEDTTKAGVIHVYSAGNSFENELSDSNKVLNQSSPYAITVAALGSDGTAANYSSFGANVFATALSGTFDPHGFQITTTDRTGAAGYNDGSGQYLSPLGAGNNHYDFNGTSASAPLVSGILALGKQANPGMDARMAKHVLAMTSDVVDAGDTSAASAGGWQTNGAGYKFNPRYGFGNINAGDFVSKVHTAGYVSGMTMDTGNAFTGATGIANGGTYTDTISIAGNTQPIEAIRVTLDIDPDAASSDRRDLRATLSSDSNGTTSRILYEAFSDDRFDPDIEGSINWTFTTYAFFGETANADWTLTVEDTDTGNTVPFTLNSASIDFHMGDIQFWSAGTNNVTDGITPWFFSVAYDPATVVIQGGDTVTVDQHTYVTAGTLQVDGTLDSDTTDFDAGAALTQTGGSVKVGGAGTINLDRSYNQINGSLDVDGAINVGSAYNQTGGTVDVSGTISGDTYNQSGNGIVALDGAINLTGAYNLNSGLLQGTGTVTTGGSLKPAGVATISPGNSIGTLNVVGDVDFAGGGILEIEKDAVSNDVLNITGTGKLTGGTLKTTIIDPNFTPDRNDPDFDIITATTITGEFSTLDTIIAPALEYIPTYASNKVTLSVSENFANPILRGFMTPNGVNAGLMLNSVAGGAPTADQRAVMDHILAIGAAPFTAEDYQATAQAVEQIAPKNMSEQFSQSLQAADTQTALFQGRSRTMRSAAPSMSYTYYEWQTRKLLFGDEQPLNLVADTSDFTSLAYRFDPIDYGNRYQYTPSRTTVWGSGSATFGEHDTDGSDIGYDYNAFSGAFGVDYLLIDRMAVGLMAGYTTGSTDANDIGGSSSDYDSMMVGAYSTFITYGAYWDFLLGYGFNDYDLNRRIVFPGVNRTATAETDGTFITASISGGYDYKSGDWFITPFWGLRFVTTDTDGYTETGAAGLNLTVDDAQSESLKSELGLRVGYTFWTLPAIYMPEVRLSWQHEYMAENEGVTARFATPGGVSFTSFTNDAETDFGTLGTGLTVLLENDTNLSLDYDLTFSRNILEHSINGKVSHSF